MMKIDREQAVSEAIGFMVLFSLVTLGIALVSLYGYPVLMQQQTSAHERNMEQTMIVLQNDIKSLCYKNVPFKETSLSVGGGSLYAHNSGALEHPSQTFTVSYPPGREIIQDFKPGELIYESDAGDAMLIIENGAVIKKQEDQSGSVMLAEPRWFYDNDTKTLVINNIEITADGVLSRTGVGVVRMQVSSPEYNETEIDVGATVEIEYKPAPGKFDYSTAWRNFLTGSSLEMVPAGSNKYRLDGVQKLIVKTYSINILSL